MLDIIHQMNEFSYHYKSIGHNTHHIGLKLSFQFADYNHLWSGRFLILMGSSCITLVDLIFHLDYYKLSKYMTYDLEKLLSIIGTTGINR